MPDGDLFDFEGLDGPREMPEALRARIERGLLGGAALPDETRRRLTRRLSDSTAARLADVDGPRPMPGGLRARVEGSLARPAGRRARLERPRTRGRWVAAAAAAAVLASSVTLFTETPPGHEVALPGFEDESFGADVLYSPTPEPGEAGWAAVGDPGFASAALPTAGPGEAVDGVAAAPTVDGNDRPDPPPYAFADSVALMRGAMDRPRGTTTTALPPPFRVAIVGGDREAEAGFAAYVRLHNERASQQTRKLVAVGASDPADVVVNLSGTAGTGQAANVTVESLTAPDALLRGNVFGFAGALDRQAHLIVDAVYPQPADVTAVVYREPGGVLHDEVAAAMQTVLREKGVRVVTMDVRPNEAVVPVPADAVFLSVTAANAGRVVQAYPASARPPRGFNGVGTLAESAAVKALPPGSRFISPFAFPDSNEAAKVKELTTLPAGARVFHGWVAAKTLAVAVWQHRPESRGDLVFALESMERYANGFAPAYTFRKGTHSVQPEGVLFLVGQNGAAQQGGFLTDPRD